MVCKFFRHLNSEQAQSPAAKLFPFMPFLPTCNLVRSSSLATDKHILLVKTHPYSSCVTLKTDIEDQVEADVVWTQAFLRRALLIDSLAQYFSETGHSKGSAQPPSEQRRIPAHWEFFTFIFNEVWPIVSIRNHRGQRCRALARISIGFSD